MISEKISQLGFTLPPAPDPVGSYENSLLIGDLLYLSGGLSLTADQKFLGQVTKDLSLEEAQKAAELAVLTRLAVAQKALGSLDRVTRVVSLSGFVNAPAGFGEHPAVINGASELLVAVFGEAGRHTRTAVGVSSLPLNVAVEVAMVLQVDPEA